MVGKFDIVCFGSAVVDAFVKTNAPEKDNKILIPYGCKILMRDLFFEIGGGGTNTSVAFSRLGFKTGYIGKVGNDRDGEKILDLLKKEKIKFLGRKVKGNTTGFSVVLRSKDNHRSILTYKGINNDISIKDVKKFKTKWLYLSSLMDQSLKTQIALAKKLKAKGTKIAFNPSEYLIRGANVKPLLRMCDVVILNKEESKILDGKDPLKTVYKLGPDIVVITDERRRIYAYNGKKTYSMLPPKTKVANKTGAGDAFAAGFVSGLIINKPIQECLKLGVKEAQSVIKYLGAKNKLPRMDLGK